MLDCHQHNDAMSSVKVPVYRETTTVREQTFVELIVLQCRVLHRVVFYCIVLYFIASYCIACIIFIVFY